MKKYSFLLIGLMVSSALQAQLDKIHFEERFETVLQPVKVQAIIYQDFFPNNELLDTTIELKQDRYTLDFAGLTRMGYLELTYTDALKKQIRKIYYLQPGDNIEIRRMDKTSTYNGRGSQLCQVIDEADKIDISKAYLKLKRTRDLFMLESYQAVMLEGWQKKRAIIEQSRAALGDKMTEILLLDTHAACWQFVYQLLDNMWPVTGDTVYKKQFHQFFNRFLSADSIPLNKTAMTLSAAYPYYLFLKARAITHINKNAHRFNDVYREILALSAPPVRQKMQLYAFTKLSWFIGVDSSAALMKKTSAELTDPVLKRIFQKNFSRQIRGSAMEDFSFRDLSGLTKHLRDFKGKTILMDFWFTGCTGCKQVAPFLKIMEDSLRFRKDIVLISVSIDRDSSRWKNSVLSGDYGSTGAVNLYTGGKGADDPFLEKYNIMGYPTLMIIDKNGNLYERNPVQPRSPETMNRLWQLLKKLAN
jgi:thiol-disulfide isomerase/thioredoxin